MYTYKAKLKRLVDGDTCYLSIDVGFKITKTIDVRLRGINCPEVRGREKVYGKQVTQYVYSIFEKHSGNCEIKTYKKGKYGRYVADIYFREKEIYLKPLKLLIVQKFPDYFIKSDSKIYEYVFNKDLLI